MTYRELRVLLAEDDEEDYMITGDLLREIPGIRFSLDWAPSYEKALEAIECNRYDLCLLDYHLGPADGLQLFNAALTHGCTAPIIFLTGLDDWETDFKVMKAGAEDYLVKGQFDVKQLERSIRHAIERRRVQEGQIESTIEQLENAERLAETDALTGLGNRRRIERALQAAIGATRSLSLLVFDLNRFKQVNDRYGHSQGDQLLKLVAQRLQSAARKSDIVCRWGGDEFVVVLPNASFSAAQERARQIQGRAFGEFSLSTANGTITLDVSAEVGVAEYLAGETVGDFFERADQRLLNNKRGGGSELSAISIKQIGAIQVPKDS